jgi:acyl-CoA synthetase (AMP-forming)/AMP-acid ligase II
LPGHEGELCLAGSQVGPGYLDDPVRTAERFVRFSDEPATVWYRTGDLVREAGDGCLVFLGRIDDQIQIRGYRVEIQEIDKVLREAAGTDLCVAVPLRLAQGRAESVVAVIQGADSEAVRQRVLEACKRDLPDYMVPARVFFQAAMPLNANGKIDRKALGEGVNESSS